MYLNLQLIHRSVLILGSRSQDAEDIERLGLLSPDMEAVEHARTRIETIAHRGLSEARLDANDVAAIRRCGELLFDEVMPFTLRQWLSEARAEHEELVIQSCAGLFGLPFELMHTGASFLSATLPIRRVRPDFIGKAGDTVAGQTPRPCIPTPSRPARYALIGDPAGDLAAAREEATKLYEQFRRSGRPIELRNADVYADEVAGALERCEHAHIAGHFDEGRLRCANEEHFEAWETLISRPRSLTLNGCSSLLHKGALTETAAAALRAGVRSLIGTSLPVPDTFALHLALRLQIDSSDLAYPDHRSLFHTKRALTELYGEEAFIWGAYTYIGEPSTPEIATGASPEEQNIDRPDARSTRSWATTDSQANREQHAPGTGPWLARGKSNALEYAEALERRLKTLEKMTLILVAITAILLLVTLSR